MLANVLIDGEINDMKQKMLHHEIIQHLQIRVCTINRVSKENRHHGPRGQTRSQLTQDNQREQLSILTVHSQSKSI